MIGEFLHGLASIAVICGVIYATFWLGWWMVGAGFLLVVLIGVVAGRASDRRMWEHVERARRAGNS